MFWRQTEIYDVLINSSQDVSNRLLSEVWVKHMLEIQIAQIMHDQQYISLFNRSVKNI